MRNFSGTVVWYSVDRMQAVLHGVQNFDNLYRKPKLPLSSKLWIVKLNYEWRIIAESRAALCLFVILFYFWDLTNLTFLFTFLERWAHQTALNLQSRGGSRIFFRRGCTRLLLCFNTNKPHFFLQNTSCIRKPQVISGGVRTPCTLPLDPPLQRQEWMNEWMPK